MCKYVFGKKIYSQPSLSAGCASLDSTRPGILYYVTICNWLNPQMWNWGYQCQGSYRTQDSMNVHNHGRSWNQSLADTRDNCILKRRGGELGRKG